MFCITGGPLVIRHHEAQESTCIFTVVGIVSKGNNCHQTEEANKASTYTRVSAYVDWIECIVWNVSCHQK